MRVPSKLIYGIRLLFTPRSSKTMEWHLLCLTNAARKRAKCSTLFMQDDLRRVARKHSRDMAKRNYFAHENTAGHSPFDRNTLARVTDAHTGENLAMIRGYSHPTQKAFDGLMNSPGHKANILQKDYNCIGIGVIQAENGTYYFTQNFARRVVILRRIPKSVRRGKALLLRGRTISPLQAVVIRIQGSTQPLYVSKRLSGGQKFTWTIAVPQKQREVSLELLTSTNGSIFSLANTFSVKQRKWL